MIITIQGFLCIKMSPYDGAGRIINGSMEIDFGIAKPEMDRSIHLDHLPKIGTAGPAGMSIGELDDRFLDAAFFFFGSSVLQSIFEFLDQELFGTPDGSWREDEFLSEDAAEAERRDGDVIFFLEEFAAMGEIGIPV